MLKECPYEGRWHNCNDTHNTLLHRGRNKGVGPTAGQDRQDGLVGTAMSIGGSVMLDVVPIKILANGKTVETNGLLDSGSQLPLIRNDIAPRLRFSGPKQQLKSGTFHGKDPKMITQRLLLSVSAMDNSASFQVPEVYSVDELNISPIRANIATLKARWRHLSDLNLSETDDKDVTMIIDMRRDENIENASDGILTPFGWIAVGCTGKATAEVKGIRLEGPESRPQPFFCFS